MQRRDFLKQTSLALGAAAVAQGQAGRRVAFIVDPADATAGAAPVQWAAGELKHALAAHQIEMATLPSTRQAGAADFVIVASGHRSALARATVNVPDGPESLALAPAKDGGRAVLLACGSDARGLTYAVLELADRARHAASPLDALQVRAAAVERPNNEVRSSARLFCSDVEDKPWFNDREMWPEYLSMLAYSRFNRFNLSLGIGYDFLREVTDAYFLFAYPFFLDVPGYKVRAVNLPDAERDHNLEMLKYISEQTEARGLEFQLGVWMHGYEWINSPHPNYTIEGITAANHANYCRDALAALLKACPAITGVTLRIHGESGVAEGSYDFWKTVFDGIVRSGRRLNFDLHAKGLDFPTLDNAIATGLPVAAAPKYWAEHWGMPYHQTDIRTQEIPKEGRTASGLMALSSGSRSFTRYGYADFMRDDRKYGIIHRIWPGTQRLLLWGDPVFAAGYSRAFAFSGSNGVEWQEPLSFKGRRGSGHPGGRCAYADASLKPRWDWQKYAYSYRVFGRLLYNPNADADVWRRAVKAEFPGAVPAEAEAALANASRILPIITSAHGPSAANNTYWPEIYTNQPMVQAGRNPYTDTPAPKVFQNAEAFDPKIFSRMNEHADELLKDEVSGKYSPIEVAQWLEDLAGAAAQHLAKAGKSDSPAFRRFAIDVDLQASLGKFFASKFRAGVLYSIHERTGDRGALEEALKAYRAARETWAQMAERVKTVYVADVTVGEHPFLRGHWLDRLPAIDADITDMAKRLDAAKPATEERVRAAVAAATGRPNRGAPACRHTPPQSFRHGAAIPLEVAVETKPAAVHLYYRHVNQAERYQKVEMQPAGGRFTASIPAVYTSAPYPIQYYFEYKGAIYPGFAPDHTGQPYFVVPGKA